MCTILNTQRQSFGKLFIFEIELLEITRIIMAIYTTNEARRQYFDR